VFDLDVFPADFDDSFREVVDTDDFAAVADVDRLAVGLLFDGVEEPFDEVGHVDETPLLGTVTEEFDRTAVRFLDDLPT